MASIVTFLSGKKSYIILVVAFCFNLGVLASWWTVDNQIWGVVDTTLVTLLGASFRAAINKV